MKFLFILRHAKSSWDDPTLEDFDRPLNARGIKTAPLMGQMAIQKHFLFDVIVSSPAKRAKETAELFAKEINCTDKIQYVPSFYPGDSAVYMDALSHLNDQMNHVLIIGHNPGLEIFLEQLTHQHETLPTATLAQIQLPIKRWTDLSLQTKGQLICVLKPKELFT